MWRKPEQAPKITCSGYLPPLILRADAETVLEKHLEQIAGFYGVRSKGLPMVLDYAQERSPDLPVRQRRRAFQQTKFRLNRRSLLLPDIDRLGQCGAIGSVGHRFDQPRQSTFNLGESGAKVTKLAI